MAKKKAVGAAVGAKAAKGAARGAGKMALRGGARAVTPRDPATTRYLRYGFFALVGFAIGALVARSGNKEDASTFTGTTGQHTPDLGSPAGQRGETWGSGTPLETAGGAAGAASETDIGTAPSQHQRPEDPNRTGAEREYSDPSSGPLVGRGHRGRIGEVPEQQEEIENRIRTRVGEDPRTLDVPRLNVEVNEGVADIRGEVHSEEEKQAVEEIASSVEGVTEVRNLITVNTDAPSRRGKAAGGDTH
ncbi:MAG: BON domain-containing protein [Actinomycetota bacterium]|nr:BON domain-containing protein [Actinomycetota bacterium]